MEEVTDIDSKSMKEGLLNLRLARQGIVIQILNARMLLLEEFHKFIRKILEGRTIGSSNLVCSACVTPRCQGERSFFEFLAPQPRGSNHLCQIDYSCQDRAGFAHQYF